jgi:hypothetical protein
MIKLSEFMVEGGLFSAIESINPLPFLGDGQNEVMDRLLIIQYGDRSIYSKVTPLTLPQIAEMVVMLNVDNWNDIILLGDINKSAKSVRTITETTINDENRINTRDDKNVVSAFNADDLIVNDGTLTNGTDNLNGTETRTMTDELTDLTTAYKHLSLSQKNNIMNVVLKDIADFITLNIY